MDLLLGRGAMKAGTKGVQKARSAANGRWGRGGKFADARSKRRQERAAASYMGMPESRLGKMLQGRKATHKDAHGNWLRQERRWYRQTRCQWQQG